MALSSLRSIKQRSDNTCAYNDCSNSRQQGHHLYAFPRKENPLHAQWIARVGNPNLKHLAASTMRRFGICAEHFSPEMFINTSFCQTAKRKLKMNAVPEPWTNRSRIPEEEELLESSRENTAVQEVQELIIEETIIISEPEEEDVTIERIVPLEEEDYGEERCQYRQEVDAEATTRVYSRRSLNFSDSDDDMMLWTSIEPFPMQRKQSVTISRLRNRISSLQRNNRFLRKQLKYLKRKIQRAMKSKILSKTSRKRETVDEFLNRHKCLNNTARTMVKLQLKKDNAQYSMDDQNLAKMVFYNSPTAYNNLRKSGCHLPAESTVRRWIAANNIQSGFADKIFNNIKIRLSQFPLEQRLCALKWDEMSIKTWEEYSAYLDQVEGLVDLGSLGRRDAKAHYVFVFCVDSINAENRWRQPLAYFLSGRGGLKAEDIIELLHICLRRLTECGALVKILTCDQCSTNQKVYRQMGVTEDNPFFNYEGTTYYATFDFPHLIKRLVTQLRNHGRIYVGNENIISFSDMYETWNYDRTMNSSRLLSHITETHIKPNAFQTMNVKRAFQMFGRRFAAAIRVAGQDSRGLQGRSTTWENTAESIKRIDKLIDFCNCYYISSNCKKKPLCKQHDVVYKHLHETMDWTKTWSLRPYGQECPHMQRPPCFKGLTQTLGAFLQVYDAITTEEITRDFKFAIGLANQDSVEHLFSKLRQRGGFNFNPTSRMVRLNLRHIMCSKLIKSGDRTNTQEEAEESQSLIGVESSIPAQCNFTGENCLADPEDEAALECAIDFQLNTQGSNMDTNEGQSLYEATSITYFAGYIVHYIMKKYNCTECRDTMMKTPLDCMRHEEQYIANREYSDDDDDEYGPDITKLSRPTEAFVNMITVQLKIFNDHWKMLWHQKDLLQDLHRMAIRKINTQDPAWFKKENSCYEHRVAALKHLYKVKLHAQARRRNEEEKSLRAAKKPRKLRTILHE